MKVKAGGRARRSTKRSSAEKVISVHHHPLRKNLALGLLPTPLHNGACLVIRRKHKEKREEALKDEAGMKITLSSVDMQGP